MATIRFAMMIGKGLHMSERVKLDILLVGTFNEEGMPIGWCFGGIIDTDYDGPAILINPPNNPNEDILVGGYTLDELREIHDQKYGDYIKEEK